MIPTVACIAGFFLVFTYLMLTQWTKRKKLAMIRVSLKWEA